MAYDLLFPFTSRHSGVLRHNLIANTLDGALFAFGLSFVSFQTVLPVFIQKIGGGNVAVGLIPVVWMLGFNLTQILIANHAQRLRIKKRLLLKTAFFQRLPWLLLAVLAYFIIPRVSDWIGLILFFVLFAAAAIAGSINLPVWFDMIAKMTPVDLRGRLFAARLLIGGILGIGGGIVANVVLDSMAFPGSFGLLFLLAFSAMLISYYTLTVLKEPRGKSSVQPLHLAAYLRSFPKLFKQECNYCNFLIADALLYLALMANGFFTVHALHKFTLPDYYAGTFTAIMMGSTIIGTLFFGHLADHYGQRINLMLAAAMIIFSCALAITVRSVNLYYLVFIGSALTTSLTQISRLPILAELCSEEQRPTFVALANLVSSPFILAGIAAGWIANHFGFDSLFIIAGAFALFSLGWFHFKVQEPRKIAGIEKFSEHHTAG